MAGQFTIETIDFWWNDDRICNEKAAVKSFYFYACQAALACKREVLPNHKNVANLSRRSGQDTRSGQNSVAKLRQNCLLEISDDGRIIVCGITDRYPEIEWIREDITYQNGRQYVSKMSHRAEYRREEKRISPPTPPRGNLANASSGIRNQEPDQDGKSKPRFGIPSVFIDRNKKVQIIEPSDELLKKAEIISDRYPHQIIFNKTGPGYKVDFEKKLPWAKAIEALLIECGYPAGIMQPIIDECEKELKNDKGN